MTDQASPPPSRSPYDPTPYLIPEQCAVLVFECQQMVIGEDGPYRGLIESVRSGMLDDLDGPDLAAVISVFTHETRARDAPPVWYPSPTVEVRVGRVGQVWEQLADRERSAGLDPTRAPDAGLAVQVWQWAQGDELDDVLTGTVLTGGDLVRGVRQIVDLCRQIGVAYADTTLGTRARRVADQLWRGVVAAA